MDKSTIRKEIAALINSIKEHSDNIGDNKHIPQIELELILHKIEKLYQKSIVFNHLNSNGDIHQNSGTSKPIVETPKVEVKEEAVKSVTSDKPIDLFGSEIPPVTEKPKQEKKVEKKEEKPVVVVSNKIQKPSIQDLTKAIGLNDKFLFANELFEGNMQEYNIAIQQLNGAGSLESAMDYFSSLQQLYDWDMEKETVKQLVDLVDRRYS